MADEIDALGISAHCLLLGLLAELLRKGLIARDEAVGAIGHADFFLAQFPPTTMTDRARELAQKFLRDVAKSLEPRRSN